MKTKLNPDLRHWGFSLALALTVNVSLWAIAASMPGKDGIDFADFGVLQWKAA